MTYKESITDANCQLAKDPLVRFLGYGLKAGRAIGTLKAIPDEQIIETPVAENLMVGLAIGLSLKGLRPVVYIERMDFILNALDATVNHLDKIRPLSQGEFSPAVIFRVVVGNKNKPLYTGLPHIQDFTEPLRRMLSFPVITVDEEGLKLLPYKIAADRQKDGCSTMLVEYKDLM